MKELNNDQQIKILKLARNTINCKLNKTDIAAPDMRGEFSDDIFAEIRGAFVTIHINGRLRGCIGQIIGSKNIPSTIIDMALCSAFKDPRFPPLSNNEFKQIDIEISILTPIETVTKISDIVIGRDGLIITCGYRCGLLLPQVATECKWDLEQFLEHTCYKAGLPGDSWKNKGTKIEKFSAQVFGEKNLGLV